MHEEIFRFEGGKSIRLRLRKTSFIIFQISLEFFDELFVGINEERIIELKFELTAIGDSHINVNIAMIASDGIQRIHDLCPSFSHLDAVESLQHFYFHRVRDSVILYYYFQEFGCVFLQHCFPKDLACL